MSDATPLSNFRRPVFWLAGLATFVALAFFGVSRTYPPLPRELTLTVKFPDGIPGRTEPLIASGRFGDADFITINYLSPTTATFSYDYWGFGGPTSAPFTYRPGERHTLRVAMPAFIALLGTLKTDTALLRLEFDGRGILEQAVPYHQRRSDLIFFGENPVGGTTAGGIFRGEILTGRNRIVAGPPTAFFSRDARIAAWVALKPGEVVIVVLLSIATAFLAGRVASSLVSLFQRRLPSPGFTGHTRAPHGWFIGSTAVCAIAFLYVVTGGTFRLVFPEEFGSFYDHQAVSLLHGHLDVPSSALDGEAFAYGGKLYGYFGPTPALLRLPFAFFETGFCQLSRSFLLGYYLASLAAVYALLIHASRLLSTRATWPSRVDVILLVVSAGLGTTLFFVSSRAYIYHEAILCGVAFALWSSWCSLRWLAQPASRWWLGALACGVLAVHSRPPVGLFALSLLGCVAAAHLWQSRAAGLRTWLRPITIGLLSVFGVFSFNALSYLKFKTFDGAPLKYHVQYHPARLAAIDGKNFHLSNFRYNFDGYIWRPNFHVGPAFPYFFVDGRNPNEYRGTKIDLAEPTLALPYTAPSIVFLALAGTLVAAFRWPTARLPLALLALASVPMSAALFMAVAISQRYTADFCPALLVAASFGLVAFELLPRGLLRTTRIFTATLALCAMFITAALTLSYQGDGVWGVPADVKARYQSIRNAVDGFFHSNSHDR
jgi:hypothetical protein